MLDNRDAGPVRLTILTEIPAPFRIPLFNALAARDDVQLRVLFLSANDPRRQYADYSNEFEFDWRVLPGRDILRGGRWLVLNRGVRADLRRHHTQAILSGGWNQPACWQALAFSRLHTVPLLAWVESTLRDERSEAGFLERAKRIYLRSAAGCVVPGTASRAYVEALGVPSDRVFVAPNAVDQRIFRDAAAAARGRRPEIRARLGLDGCVFLYVGRLDREKGVDVLIDAAAKVPDATIAIVSAAGGEAESLRARAGENVRFVGRVERDDLPGWYAAADAFVLPSRSEQWGMVVNEAAAAGLPVIATDAVGAASDLIDDGVSGFVVRAGDVAALAGALERVSADPDFRASAGRRSAELASPFTPEAWAEGVARSVAYDPRRDEGASE